MRGSVKLDRTKVYFWKSRCDETSSKRLGRVGNVLRWMKETPLTVNNYICVDHSRIKVRVKDNITSQVKVKMESQIEECLGEAAQA